MTQQDLRIHLVRLSYATRPLFKRALWFLDELSERGHDFVLAEIERELDVCIKAGWLEKKFDAGNRAIYAITLVGINAVERKEL
jgi:hypothetical protein